MASFSNASARNLSWQLSGHSIQLVIQTQTQT